MRLLVTGADGFVGRWLVRAARREGYAVIASIMPTASVPAEWSDDENVVVVRADFRELADVARLAAIDVDAVVHLAAIASGTAARENPEEAILVNAERTSYFGERLTSRPRSPRLLFVSTAEVYGPGHDGPIAESAPRSPRSPYAVSKASAELPLEELWRESGLPLIMARPFPHTGPGQAPLYVLPALAGRLKAAKAAGETVVKTGNLSVVRDFLDVRDVVRAYLLLLQHGKVGEAYNVASGVGRRLTDCFTMLAAVIGIEATASQDASLLRPDDIAVLIGDTTKLRDTTGWSPQIPFEQTLQDLVDAQAD